MKVQCARKLITRTDSNVLELVEFHVNDGLRFRHTRFSLVVFSLDVIANLTTHGENTVVSFIKIFFQLYYVSSSAEIGRQ